MSQTTTLIALARNEGPFLLEWVAYHRAIGFDHIIVLSDTSQDGTEALLDRLAAADALVHVSRSRQTDSEAKGFRARAYGHALSMPQVQNADWVMALDIDEYLNINVGTGTVADLLEAYAQTGPTDVISLNWRIFGNAGHAQFINRMLLPRMTRAAPLDPVLSDKHLGVKSLFRPGIVKRIGPHRPHLMDTHTKEGAPTHWRNGTGHDVTDHFLQKGWASTPQTSGTKFAQVNHYVVRSNAVFALHNMTSPPLGAEQNPMTLADHGLYNANHVTDTSITRWAQATTEEIKRLQGSTGVQAAHKTAVVTFQTLIAEMEKTAEGEGDRKILGLLDTEKAKSLMTGQAAWIIENAGNFDRAAPLQMVDPEDMAPRWLADLRRSGHKRGWYYSDDTFGVQMTTRSSDTLVVSFDNLSDVADSSLARNTWGYPFYRDEGWSHMGVLAFEKHWYRDPRLFNFLEGQVQTGIFTQFRKVIFTGTTMGAYAATAFSALVPGCTVVALSPQSTLDKALVPWEDRFGAGRKQDWSGRYRDAAEGTGSAAAVYLIYDPYCAPDKAHADRFSGENIHHLHCWYTAHKSADLLRKLGILKDIMRAAADDTLTPAMFYKAYRARRQLPWYYTNLIDQVFAKGHTHLASDLARYLEDKNKPGLAQDIKKRL